MDTSLVATVSADRPVLISQQESISFSYGTYNTGVPIHISLWTAGICKFHIDACMRGSQKYLKTNPPRLNDKKLPEVDVLVAVHTSQEKTWNDFLYRWSVRKSPTKIIVVIHPWSIVMKDKALYLKATQSFFRHRGYQTRSDFVDTAKCGAQLNEKYYLTVCFHSKNKVKWSDRVSSYYLNLPQRSSENMIEDYGRKVYQPFSRITRTDVTTVGNFLGTHNGEPVYTTDGPLGGEQMKQWVSVEGKGFRRILNSEWCKLKGYQDIEGCTHSLEGLSRSVNSNLWSVLSYVIKPLLEQSMATVTDNMTGNPGIPIRSTCPPDEVNLPTWTWHPPDLSVGSDFYKGNIARLRQALWSFPKSEHQNIYDDGLLLLKYHRDNYGDDGIKTVLNLWYNWPSIHWYELYYGISMNFMELPEPGLIPNQQMDSEKIGICVKFMDKLIKLRVFQKVPASRMYNNMPLFCVPKPKPEQKGEFRCISNGKTGGQNRVSVPDPVQMTDPAHILPRLYEGGWYFHCFRTQEHERWLMGIIHPESGDLYHHLQCAMGTSNSPGGTGRSGFSFIRFIIESSDLFGSGGTFFDNTMFNFFESKQVFHPGLGEGRIYFSKDGTPAVLIFIHVDDIFLHAATLAKLQKALDYILNVTLWFGLVIQPVKVVPPSQQVEYCGFIYNTKGIPCLEIPDYKISRAITMIDYLLSGSYTKLARMTLSVVTGTLQSLVPATPSNVGAAYLRSLYDDLYNLSSSPLIGSREYFFTTLQLSENSRISPQWWKLALQGNIRRYIRPTDMLHLCSSFGDGSGTGTGGTITLIPNTSSSVLSPVDCWMGVWSCQVHSFSSNYKGLSTLLLTLKREIQRVQQGKNNRFRHRRLIYFTDNSTTYYICHNSSSPTPALMQLIASIRLLELQLECQIEVIHVPGVAMILQGTDGLSRGVMPSQFGLPSNFHPVASLFRPAFASLNLVEYVCHLLNLHHHDWKLYDDNSPFCRNDIINTATFWTIHPALARQFMLEVTYAYCEAPLTTTAVFVLPRLLTRQYERINKYFLPFGPFTDLPVGFPHIVPFMVYYLPPFDRVAIYNRKRDAEDVSQLVPSAPMPSWIDRQLDTMRGLS